MGNPQLLVLFLKALLAAKKSLNLYPAGSEMSTAWIQRLHRSLDGFFQQGLSFPIRVARDRFQWAGEDLVTVDPALESFRFELEARGIAEFSIDSGVEDWELETFLGLLNLPATSLESFAGAGAHLRARNVVHVTVGAPGIGTGGARAPTLELGGGESEEGDGADPNRSVLQTGRDVLDLFVDQVLAMVEERLTELTYDRAGLLTWLQDIAAGDQVDRLYTAVKMLCATAEGSGDREVQTRTMLEAILLLPESTLRPFLSKWLVPLAGSDLVAFNLLTQVTEDELNEIARLVPKEQLLALTSELLEFPWEEGKRQRLLEAITWTLRPREGPESPVRLAPVLSRDDPLLVELRQEIVASCHPDVLLERSTDILLALVYHVESDEYPGFAMDAIEEIVGEALARGKLDLAVRALSTVGVAPTRREDWVAEHGRRLALLLRRVAGRPHIALVAGLLRQSVSPEQMALAADYLRLVTREGVEEFTALLADERDRRVRARMCQVLATAGPSIIPVLLPWLEDARWYVVRNIVYVLGKLGDESTFMSVVAVLEHAHPRVRVETIRALGLIGGGLATSALMRCVADPDPTVRLAVVKSLGSLRSDEVVPVLRDLVASPATTPEDLEVTQEAINALVTIGSPVARTVLTKLAGRRVWFWERNERRIRDMAAEALGVQREAGVGAREERDG